MTVETLDNRVVYTADGLRTAFDFAFPVVDDVAVYLVDIATRDSVLQTVSQYSLTLADDVGGVVTFGVAPLATQEVLITRSTNFRQPLAIQDITRLRESQIETAYDRMTIFCIQLLDMFSRTLVQPVGTATPNLSFPPLVRDKFLSNDGSVLQWIDATGVAYPGNITFDLASRAPSDPTVRDIFIERDTGYIRLCRVLGEWSYINIPEVSLPNTLPHTTQSIVGDGDALEIDLSLGQVIDILLEGNVPMVSFVNPPSSNKSLDIKLRVRQDVVGSRVISAWDADIKFARSLGSTRLSTTPHHIDYIGAMYYAPSDEYHVIAYTKGIV